MALCGHGIGAVVSILLGDGVTVVDGVEEGSGTRVYGQGTTKSGIHMDIIYLKEGREKSAGMDPVPTIITLSTRHPLVTYRIHCVVIRAMNTL